MTRICYRNILEAQKDISFLERINLFRLLSGDVSRLLKQRPEESMKTVAVTGSKLST
jgi:hypothetical protein